MKNLVLLTVLLSLSSASLATTKVSMKNGNVKVQQNGITTEYGKVRDVKERNGKVEIYTNKMYSKPVVTIDRQGSITTQRSSNSDSVTCRYNCDFEGEDE